MAKLWTLIDPDGVRYEVVNLSQWCRENSHLFGKTPDQFAAIRSGFIQVAQYMKGKSNRVVTSYMGWRLAEPPRELEEETGGQDATPRESIRDGRVCPVCGKAFPAFPSDPNVTCSPECRAIWTQERHAARSNRWSEGARRARREQGRPEQLKRGSDAAKSLPGGQRGETNREAKVWELVSPDGEIFVVTNLLNWSRENAWRFGMEASEAGKIRAGFTAVARSMCGLTKRPVGSYKGWGLSALPGIPGLDPAMERLRYPAFVKLRSMARNYPHTGAAASMFARDAGCSESGGALDVLQMILDCADGGLPNIRGVSGLTREEFADRYSLPLKSVAQWEADPKGITAWAERMLAYVVIVDRMQAGGGTENSED